MAATHKRVLAENYALIRDTLNNQLDPLAGKVVEILAQRGALTLKQIADAIHALPESQSTSLLSSVRSARTVRNDLKVSTTTEALTDPKTISDLALKEVVTRLVLHRVVHNNKPEKLYSVAVSDAILLRVFSPLIAHRVERQYGPSGLALFIVLHQLAVVPWSSAVRLAQQRHPHLAKAVAVTAGWMEEDGWVEFIAAPPANAGVGRKRPRAEDVSSFSDEHCRLSTFACVRALFDESLQHYVAGIFAEENQEVMSAVVSVFTSHIPQNETTALAGDSEEVYTPLLAPHSEELSLNSLTQSVKRRCPAATAEHVAMCVKSLGGNHALVEAVTPGVYRLSVQSATSALHETTCERVIFARYGTLGVRIIKLLSRNNFLEDKILAEEAIATQPKTRELLHAMMRDGYVALQEVPRSSVMAERAAKSSTFLWTCSPQSTLLSSMLHVTRSLIFSMRNLHHQQRLLEESGGVIHTSADGPQRLPGCSGGALRTPENPLVYKANTQQLWRSTIGYQSSSLSLMRLLLVLDYL